MKIIIKYITILIFLICSQQAIADEYADYMTKLRGENRNGSLKWKYGCNTDEFTDFKSCHMVMFLDDYPSIRLETLKDLGVTISFGLNNDPTMHGKVRIDDYKVETYKNSVIFGSQAKTIIKQMKAGRKLISKTYIWPSDSHNFSFDLQGFTEAYIHFTKTINLYNKRSK